jgi:cellulose synthase/poly-beta-1,6-N-acetylglucosamine synthase-like glycosyltransferase
MIIVFYIAAFIIIAYCFFIGWVTRYIRPEFKRGGMKVHSGVSIIIPCRNEAGNISRCLKSIALQTLPASQYEIIVVDDFSEDATVREATEFKNKLPLNILQNTIAGKKNAIMMGIAFAANDIVITVDADCTMEHGWLKTMLRAFEGGNLNMLCGPVNFAASGSLFKQLQQAESAAIVGISSVMLGRGKPATCNGANLMFRKQAFMAIGGYGRHSVLATGDDDLLMHAFYKHDPAKVAYSLNTHAMVYAEASPGFRLFLQQRVRWLSKRRLYSYKWNNYLQWLVLLQLVAFYFLLGYTIFTCSLIGLALLLNKFLFDMMLGIKLRTVFHFKYWLILFMPFFEFYIFILPFYARFAKKNWKGRAI